MAGSADVCLGIIVAIVIVLISYTAWRRWQRLSKSPKFTYTTPASQDLVKASDHLTSVLDGILELGKKFEIATDESSTNDESSTKEETSTTATEETDMVIVDSAGSCSEPVRQDSYPSEIRMSILSVTIPATRIVENLRAANPTYAGIHAVYKGLSGADGMYQRVAEVYIAKGSSIKCTPLINVGKQLHMLVRAIHELGSALNLE